MPVLLLLLFGMGSFPAIVSAADLDKTAAQTTTATATATPAGSIAQADPLAALDSAQTQDLLQWLSQHAPDPAALSQEALNRAALRSLLADPRTGAIMLSSGNPPPPVPPFYATAGPATAYVRAGSLTKENIATLSAFLTTLEPEVNTLLLDLRAPQPPAPLAGAAALTSLFIHDKTPLCLLVAPPASPALLTTSGPPVWTRRLWLLVDHQTPPPAGLAAHLLVRHLNALTFGTPTSGILTETTDRPLGPHHVVRLPAATVSLPDGSRLTGTPLVPQITIQPNPDSRAALLALTDPAVLAAHVMETDRPRPNEAVLMTGTPPETLTSTPFSEKLSLPDPVLQQALDLLQTTSFLKLDAPEEIKRAQPGR